MDSLAEARAPLALSPYYPCRAPGLLVPYYQCRAPGLLASWPAYPVDQHFTGLPPEKEVEHA
jgi:hypothetical protein